MPPDIYTVHTALPIAPQSPWSRPWASSLPTAHGRSQMDERDE